MATTKTRKTSKRRASKAKAPKKSTKDIVTEVSGRIIDALQDVIDGKSSLPPWVKSWKGSPSAGGLPHNGLTGRPYRGSNVFFLFMSGHDDARWYTFDQAKQAAGYRRNSEWKGKHSTYQGIKKWLWKGEGEDPGHGVRRGEKATHVLLWKPTKYKKKVEDPTTGEETTELRQGMYVRFHAVFNHEQCDMPAEQAPKVEEVPVDERAEALEQCMLDQVGALELAGGITHGGNRACYNITSDSIRMPKAKDFTSIDNYVSTGAHECVHATGAKKRLGRSFGKRFGDNAYAAEELVAEMGAAFMSAHLGLQGKLHHEEYLGHWIKSLRDDPYVLLTTAREAERAFRFLLGEGDTARSYDDNDTGAKEKVAA